MLKTAVLGRSVHFYCDCVGMSLDKGERSWSLKDCWLMQNRSFILCPTPIFQLMHLLICSHLQIRRDLKKLHLQQVNSLTVVKASNDKRIYNPRSFPGCSLQCEFPGSPDKCNGTAASTPGTLQWGHSTILANVTAHQTGLPEGCLLPVHVTCCYDLGGIE